VSALSEQANLKHLNQIRQTVSAELAALFMKKRVTGKKTLDFLTSLWYNLFNKNLTGSLLMENQNTE
jgi:hypothetical protein